MIIRDDMEKKPIDSRAILGIETGFGDWDHQSLSTDTG